MTYQLVTTGYYNWRPVKLSNGEEWHYINTGKCWRCWEVTGKSNIKKKFTSLVKLDAFLVERQEEVSK